MFVCGCWLVGLLASFVFVEGLVEVCLFVVLFFFVCWFVVGLLVSFRSLCVCLCTTGCSMVSFVSELLTG